MDVLFVCDEAPTLARPRPSGLIAALHRRGHSVGLIFADGDGTAFDQLAERCRKLIPVCRRRLAAAVEAELASERYDLVHVDCSAAALLDRKLPVASVLDAAFCDSLRLERALRYRGPLGRAMASAELAGLRASESQLLTRYDRVIAAFDDDAAALRVRAGEEQQRRVHVVPCPVDTERLVPPRQLRESATLLLDLRGLRRDEQWAALDGAEAMLAALRAQRADVGLSVLGHIPRRLMGRLGDDPLIRFVGPAYDPRGALGATTLAVAPLAVPAALTGALEAMATATATILPAGLARDLGAAHGEETLVAEGPAEQAWAVLALLDDPPFRGRLGRAGRRLAEHRHGYERVIVALESVYEAATGSAIAEWRLELGLDRQLEPQRPQSRDRY